MNHSWRPPYGDTDVRVHAIAKEIFGLSAILWNQEYDTLITIAIPYSDCFSLYSTNDWELPQANSLQAINASMTKWLTGKQFAKSINNATNLLP